MNEDALSEDKRSDSKYRRYVAAIEKCLQSFESVSEWADVISFLSRLTKVFQSFPTINSVPHKLQLAKRLAQCLNPALPAGVHQKTLEVYEMIFRKIGTEELAKDLSFYAFGLFPFFEHSATLVKNSLLELYEAYLIPLGSALRPALRSLILSIIPGLEEESSEHFSQVNSLLNLTKTTVGEDAFYEAIWSGLLVSPRHRLAIVNFVLKNVPQKISDQELVALCVNNPRLVSRALAEAVLDPQALVVRGVLDIVLRYFPVGRSFFSRDDTVDLTKSVLQVLMRKDMSLSRRFYTWVLDTLPGATEQQEHLSEHNLGIIVEAVRRLLQARSGSADELGRPFKLLVFVLDKPVIADPLVRECLLDLITFLQDAEGCLDGDSFEKLQSSANMFFRMLDLDLIWGRFCREVIAASKERPIRPIVAAIAFATRHLMIIDENSSMIHLHLMLFALVKARSMAGEDSAELDASREVCELGLCLMAKASLAGPAALHVGKEAQASEAADVLLERLMSGVTVRTDSPAAAVSQITASTLKILLGETDFLFKGANLSSGRHAWLGLFETHSRLVGLHLQLARGSGYPCTAEVSGWIKVLLAQIKGHATDSNVLLGLLDHLVSIEAAWGDSFEAIVVCLIGSMLPSMWARLCKTSGRYDNDLFLIIGKIYRHLPAETDQFFAEVMSGSIVSRDANAIEVFTVFWDLFVASRSAEGVPFRLTALLLTDSLTSYEFRSMKCAAAWISAISKHLRVLLVPMWAALFDIIEAGLMDCSSSGPAGDPPASRFNEHLDVRQLIYYISLLRRLLLLNFNAVSEYLNATSLDPYIESRFGEYVSLLKSFVAIDLSSAESPTYFTISMSVSLSLLAIEEPSGGRPGRDQCLTVSVVSLLSILLPALNPASSGLVRRLTPILIARLTACIGAPALADEQLAFLRLLDVLFSLPSLASDLEQRDILVLADLCRRALRQASEEEIIRAWSRCLQSLALLPSADSELVVVILNDSLIKRLEELDSTKGSGHLMLVLPAIFSCILKLSNFYFTSKAKASSHEDSWKSQPNTIRSSFSLLLGEVLIEPSYAGQGDAKMQSDVDVRSVERIVAGLFKAHIWLSRKAALDLRDGSARVSVVGNSVTALRECCRELYLLNPATFTQILFSFFQKHTKAEDRSPGSFFGLFYSGQGTEFVRSFVSLCRASRETGARNSEILTRFVDCLSLVEQDELICAELWAVLLTVIKEATSSTLKYKAILHSIVDVMVRLMCQMGRSDSAKQIKDSELVMRFVESVMVAVGRLNDASQWSQLVPCTEQCGSETFNGLLMESVKDKALGQCLISVCGVLLPNLGAVFADAEKLTAIVTVVSGTLIIPELRGPLRSTLMGRVACFSLDRVLGLSASFLKSFRRELWDAFFDNSFLWMPRYYFASFGEAFRLLTMEPDRYADLIGKISLSATSSMFMSKEAEALNRALMIRRLSMLTYWGSYEGLRVHLPVLHERLVELSKSYTGYTLGEIFFLVRVLLLKLPDEAVSSLWPLIMTELVQVFEIHIRTDSAAQPTGQDFYALLQACKLIDLMLTMRTGAFLMYHWLFFDATGSEGLFRRLVAKLAGPDALPSTSRTSSGTKRRPLIEKASLHEAAELVPFLSQAETHLHTDYLIIQSVDTDFINELMVSDLIEPLEWRQ